MDRDVADASLRLVRRFCERWPDLTLDEYRQLMTPDCVYINVPMPHLTCIGPDQAHAFLSRFIENWIPVDWSISHIKGDAEVVLVERIERFRSKAGGEAVVDLHLMATFELRDGKISAWRDYFDAREAAPLSG